MYNTLLVNVKPSAFYNVEDKRNVNLNYLRWELLLRCTSMPLLHAPK